MIDHPLAQIPLRAAAALYGLAVRVRNRRFERPGHVVRASVPVVSVGNLTVGGTGKTPLVAWLAERLLDAGLAPAVVSRGYGGTAGRGPRVVSRGQGPECGPDVCGDEPYLLAGAPGVLVVVGADRPAAAAEAARLGAGVVLLDDGFQHRRLARDLDVVLLDGERPFGNGRLLPAGILREPPQALSRADVVIVTRSRPDMDRTELERVVRRHNPTAPILRAAHRRIGFFDRTGQAADPPSRALVFCGIGNPEVFRADVAACGVEIVGYEPRRDHQPYERADLPRLTEAARKLGAVPVTTEKDRVRLPGADDEPALLTLRIEARPFDQERLLGLLRDAVPFSPVPPR